MMATGWLLETGWSDQGKSLQRHLNNKTELARPTAEGGAFSQLMEALGGNTAAYPRDSKKASMAGAEGADRGGAGQGPQTFSWAVVRFGFHSKCEWKSLRGGGKQGLKSSLSELKDGAWKEQQ